AQLQGKRSMMSDEDSSQTVAKIELEDIGRQDVPLKFQEQLKAVFDAYMVIEDALVNDKASTEEEATTLLHSLEEVDMKLLKEEPGHSHWMVLDEGLQEAALAIFKTSDIQKQRDYFFDLSTYLINAVKTYGINKRSEEHTSELQSRFDLVCRLLLVNKIFMLLTRIYSQT